MHGKAAQKRNENNKYSMQLSKWVNRPDFKSIESHRRCSPVAL